MATDVTIETLQDLLARGVETADLDYKRSWNMAEKADVLELAKDVAAMESLPSGGYLVVGADDRGRPSGTFRPTNVADFDEQRIRSKFVALLGEPLSICVALHELASDWFLLIAIEPHPAGVRVMDSDRGPDGKRVWRAGDVLVRRGTSSVRWNQHEAQALLETVIARRREDWRREVALTSALANPPHDPGGLTDPTAERPLEAVSNTVAQLIRAGDRVGLDLFRRSVVRRARDAARRLAESERRDAADVDALSIEFSAHLDRLNTLALLVGRYDLPERLSDYFRSYQELQAQLDEPNSQWPVAPRGQMTLLLQCFALGGALVHEGVHAAVAEFARMPPLFTYGGYWHSMIDRVSVLAARGDQLQREDEGSVSPVTLAEPILVALLDRASEFATDDDARNDLIQFDVFRSISTFGTGKVAYPFFARFFARRAEPAFVQAVTDPKVRAAVFDGDDNALADAFRAIDQLAGRQETNFDGWRGFTDGRVQEFIAAHQTNP